MRNLPSRVRVVCVLEMLKKWSGMKNIAQNYEN